MGRGRRKGMEKKVVKEEIKGGKEPDDQGKIRGSRFRRRANKETRNCK